MQPLLSVVAICKNEKANLHGFLSSAGLIADEIIVVDTGSGDGTPEALKKLGFSESGRGALKLRRFAWKDDFSAARNHSLRFATGRWVMWMDMDDRLQKDAPMYINEFKRHELRNTAFGFQVASTTEQEGVYMRFVQLRMFPNIRGIRWTGKVHESIFESLKNKGLSMEPISECVIVHKGYENAEVKRIKAMRNAKLLEADPGESYEKYYQLGDAYYAVNAFDLGLINYYKAKSLAATPLQKNSALERIILGRMVCGEREWAQSECGLLDDGRPEKLFWEAEFAFLDKDYDKAGPLYEKILQTEYAPQSMNSYLDSYKSRATAILVWMQQQIDEEKGVVNA